MIRRDAGHDCLLITQTDHAALAETLAGHFGNSRFSKPARVNVVVKAIGLHDAGWPVHDDQPTLNDRGYPLDVFETGRELAMKAWAASAERAAQVDPYAGLLVSLHSLALSIHSAPAPVSKDESFDVGKMHEQFAVNKFQHRELERQEELRRQLGFDATIPLKHGLADAKASPQEDQLRFDFRLLQAMDLISLCLCCSKWPASQTNELLRSPTASPMMLRLTKSLDGVVHVGPWPFDIRRIDLTVPCRRIAAKRFGSVEEFRDLYAAAEVIPLSVVLAM